MIKWACDAYNVPVPTVRENKISKDSSFFRPIDWSIHLLPVHMNIAMALHEASHAITDYYYGPFTEGHGPKWLGVFVWLLVNVEAWPKEAITESLKARGLTYSKMMTPAVLKKKTPVVEVRK